MKHGVNGMGPQANARIIQPIGQLLANEGKLSEGDIARVVAVQKRSKLLFGETAVRLGLTTNADVQHVLARQHLARQHAYPSSIANLDAFNPILVTATRPHSAPSEAFRTLRSELTLRWKSEKRKLLTITGSRSGHGASVVAANLAVVFAQTGLKTLVVDANLRNSVQHEIFNIDSGPGLVGVLNEKCEMQDVASGVVAIDNLCVLPAGKRPPNPQELLCRPVFMDLITSAYAEFDIVIMDTPPILDVADAQIISSRTGACLLAVRRGVSRLTDVNQVKAVLAPSGATLVGAVISE